MAAHEMYVSFGFWTYLHSRAKALQWRRIQRRGKLQHTPQISLSAGNWGKLLVEQALDRWMSNKTQHIDRDEDCKGINWSLRVREKCMTNTNLIVLRNPQRKNQHLQCIHFSTTHKHYFNCDFILCHFIKIRFLLLYHYYYWVLDFVLLLIIVCRWFC